LKCTATECTTCKVGFGPVAGKNECTECKTKPEGMDNCDSTGAVKTCIAGYGKIGTGCSKCTVANCA